MGHDADLQRIMMNSTVVDFSKRAIESPSVIDVFASINAKREALKLASEVVRTLFNDLEASSGNPFRRLLSRHVCTTGFYELIIRNCRKCKGKI